MIASFGRGIEKHFINMKHLLFALVGSVLMIAAISVSLYCFLFEKNTIDAIYFLLLYFLISNELEVLNKK